MRITLHTFTKQAAVTPKERQTARTSFDDSDRTLVVSRENYEIEQTDISIARRNPNSWFADRLLDRRDYKTVTPEDIQIARTNLDSHFAFYITSKPEYPVTNEDKRIARENPWSKFAEGLRENPNHTIDDTDVSYIITSFNSQREDLQTLDWYLLGLLRHHAYQIHPEILTTFRENFEVNLRYNFGSSLLKNPNYPIGEPEITFARESASAIGEAENGVLRQRAESKYINVDMITAHPKYSITEEDIRLARAYPNSTFAEGLVKNPNFKVTDEDRKTCIWHPDSKFALNLTDKKDYVPTEIEINFVRDVTGTYFTGLMQSKRNIDSELAFRLLSNVFYPLSPVEIAIALTEPESKVAQGLKFNLTYLLIKDLAKKEPVGTTELPQSQFTLEDARNLAQGLGEIGNTARGIKSLLDLFRGKL